MDKILKTLVAVGVIFLALIFIASGWVLKNRSGGDLDYDSIEKIEFKFLDSSVAPEYHRSYDINIERDFISKRTHSYGKEISFEQVETNGEKFDEIIGLLKSSEIKITSGDSNPQDGCTGGTGYSIKVQLASGEELVGKQLSCGGEKTGNLEGDVDFFNNKLNAIFK